MIKEKKPIMALVAQSMMTGPRPMHELIDALRSHIKPEQAIARRKSRIAAAVKWDRNRGSVEKPELKKVVPLADQIFIGMRIYVIYGLEGLTKRGLVSKIEGDDFPQWELTESGREYAVRMITRTAAGLKRDYTPHPWARFTKRGKPDARPTKEVREEGQADQSLTPCGGDEMADQRSRGNSTIGS